MNAYAELINRITEQANELEDHPGVHLLYNVIGDGASDAEIATTEDVIGLMPDDLKALYKQANGISIIWTHKSIPQFAEEATDDDDNQEIFNEFCEANPTSDELAEYSVVYDLDNGFAGSLVIPSLEQLRDDDSYTWIREGDDYAWSDAQVPPEVAKPAGAIPFDTYFFFTMTALSWSGDGPATTLIGDDHQACFTDFKRATIPAYLDVVSSHYFLLQARQQLSSMSTGPMQPVMESYEGPSLTLQEAIELAADD